MTEERRFEHTRGFVVIKACDVARVLLSKATPGALTARWRCGKDGPMGHLSDVCLIDRRKLA
jgi:hypothetical protein